jgi:hypothetical protein
MLLSFLFFTFGDYLAKRQCRSIAPCFHEQQKHALTSRTLFLFGAAGLTLSCLFLGFRFCPD